MSHTQMRSSLYTKENIKHTGQNLVSIDLYYAISLENKRQILKDFGMEGRNTELEEKETEGHEGKD